MKVLHPDNDRTFVFIKDIGLIGEIEIGIDHPGWVTIGYVGASGNLIIDRAEWESFMELVNEINEVVKANVKTVG